MECYVNFLADENILFTDSVLTNNYGGAIKFKSSYDNVVPGNIMIVMKNLTFRDNFAKKSGLQFILTLIRSWFSKTYIIRDCIFINNEAYSYGGAIFANSSSQNSNGVRSVSVQIIHSSFINNRANIGSALAFTYVIKNPNDAHSLLQCNFTGYDSSTSAGSVIYLTNTNLNITETKIADNKIRGIHLNTSTLLVSGNVWISQNNANFGAGIFFDCYLPTYDIVTVSHIVLASGSNLYIQDNNARDYGGGLMIRSGCPGPNLCFIQTMSNYSITLQNNTTSKIHMSGNKAGIAGDSIYGGDLENCF